MNESRRQKKVSSLIKETLSQALFEFIQDSSLGLITITRIEMTKDLRNAHIYLSIFDPKNKERILDLLTDKKGHLRKAVALRTKLKYNPMLIFSLDPTIAHEDRIDELLDKINKNEK